MKKKTTPAKREKKSAAAINNSTLSPVLTIEKKRNGEILSPEEIKTFIAGVVSGAIPDYQASAFLMATFFKGMTPEETASFTQAMLLSGDVYDFSHIRKPIADKHSTGGIGDKVSLILAPLAAACGMAVPMMAGRGLGHTGGTLDKLEAIRGFKTKLPKEAFIKAIETIGCAIIGQSETIAPADRKFYALRDVTATVECVPLIVGSILSKKLAEGTDHLILDVKVGNGAFMASKDQAKKLAKALISVAKKMNLRCRAILTNMDQPLGHATGNALELIESIELLQNGKRPVDLREVTLTLCAQMLEMSGVVKNLKDGRKLATEKLEDGSAFKKFVEMVEFQGGDVSQILDPTLLPEAPIRHTLKAHQKGFVTAFETKGIGHLLIELGAGRKKAEDTIDPSVGIVFHKKIGQKMEKGEDLATLHLPSHLDPATYEMKLRKLISIQPHQKRAPQLLGEVLK
jgi:pyrimidine-nucleoside phosphorylase